MICIIMPLLKETLFFGLELAFGHFFLKIFSSPFLWSTIHVLELGTATGIANIIILPNLSSLMFAYMVQKVFNDANKGQTGKNRLKLPRNCRTSILKMVKVDKKYFELGE